MQPKSRQRAVFCSASKYNPIRGTAISPFVGPRRYIMLNYCRDLESCNREMARHRLSGKVKKFSRLFGVGSFPHQP
jgi:hypothetical protein